MINYIERFEKIRKFINEWTRKSELPPISSQKFKLLANGANGIVKSFMRDSSRIKIQYTNSNVAYCSCPFDNPDEITINVPNFYLTREYYSRLGYNGEPLLPYYVLMTLGFVLTHETIHSLYTHYGKRQKEFLDFKFKKYNHTKLQRFVNIISNLYEDNVIHNVSYDKQYYAYIENGIDLVFDAETFELNKCNFLEKNKKGIIGIDDIIPLLMNLRNIKYFDDLIWEVPYKSSSGKTKTLSKIRDLFLRSMFVVEYNDDYLKQHAEDVYLICAELFGDDFEELSEIEFSDILVQSEFDQNGRVITIIPSSMKEVATYTGEGSSNIRFEKEALFFQIDDAELGTEKADNKQKFKITKALPSLNDSLVTTDLTSYKKGIEKRNIKPEYNGFGRTMAINKTRANLTKPIEYGKIGDELALENLHVYNKSGEIFRESNTVNRLATDFEVAIVGDMSGSMEYNDLYKIMLDALYSIGVSLNRSRSKFGVYLHTTDNYNIQVYYLGGNIKKTKSIDIGFSNTNKIKMNNNNDSDVIEWVCENAFTKKKNRKFVFMLSDGIPCPSKRSVASGLEIEDYMRYIIEEKRKLGFNIFGIALVDSVLEKNIELYGEHFTLDGSENIDRTLRKIMIKIQKGKQ